MFKYEGISYFGSTDAGVIAYHESTDVEIILKNFYRVAALDALKDELLAQGYAWGYQDALNNADSVAAGKFVAAYTVYCFEFALKRRTHKMPVGRAFKNWLEFGEIDNE